MWGIHLQEAAQLLTRAKAVFVPIDVSYEQLQLLQVAVQYVVAFDIAVVTIAKWFSKKQWAYTHITACCTRLRALRLGSHDACAMRATRAIVCLQIVGLEALVSNSVYSPLLACYFR